MIKIEMHFPDFAAAAAALTRMAGTPTDGLAGLAQSEAFVQMTPADAPHTAVMPDRLASPNFRLIESAGDGRTRRTKAEMAEDAELIALGAGFGMDAATLNQGIIAQGRALLQRDLAESGKALPSANISTAPEDRQDPENPEPADELDAEPQDEPIEDDVAPLTVDDVRAAIRAAMVKLGPADTARIMTEESGAQNVTKMDPTKYRAVVRALAEAEAKAGE